MPAELKMNIEKIDNQEDGQVFFTTSVLNWYLENKRDLPWRNTTDPYCIWLSEVMLQQTRVQQGLPYYLRFIRAFPTVHHLAAARLQQVLRLWQGLGYYTRARNLHACARQVVKHQGGAFPRQYEQLLRLPGIGPYTAAAIASIAYQQPVAVVDGNVYRVLARFFNIRVPINSTAGKKTFNRLANQLVDRRQPGEYNQAVMELGALVCTPANPLCHACPLQQHCAAFLQNQWNKLPVKTNKRHARIRYLYYLVFKANKKIYLRKRTGNDIWQGLYDFYAVETRRPHKPEKILTGCGIGEAAIQQISPRYTHHLTHQKIVARFIEITDLSKLPSEGNLRACSPAQAEKLPKPVLITRYLADTGFL